MKLGLLIIAAGYGSRFGGHKLLTKINNSQLFKIVMDKFDDSNFIEKVIVSNETEIEKYALEKKFTYIKNDKQDLGQSYSIKLGIERLKNSCDGVLISVCDQPNLSITTIERLVKSFKDDSNIVAVRSEDRLGNPNIFGKAYYNDLLNLEGDIGGKTIIKSNLNNVEFIEVDKHELKDIDRKEDIKICYLSS